MLSPLQLKNLFFKEACLKAEPSGTFESPPQLNQNLALAVLDNEKRSYRLDLDLKIGADPQKPFAYSGNFSVVGIFEVSPDFPAERLAQLVQVNGGSLLFGAIRDLILTISSRSIKGGFLLPTLNFQEVLRAAQTSQPAAETNGSPPQ